MSPTCDADADTCECHPHVAQMQTRVNVTHMWRVYTITARCPPKASVCAGYEPGRMHRPVLYHTAMTLRTGRRLMPHVACRGRAPRHARPFCATRSCNCKQQGRCRSCIFCPGLLPPGPHASAASVHGPLKLSSGGRLLVGRGSRPLLLPARGLLLVWVTTVRRDGWGRCGPICVPPGLAAASAAVLPRCWTA